MIRRALRMTASQAVGQTPCREVAALIAATSFAAPKGR